MVAFIVVRMLRMRSPRFAATDATAVQRRQHHPRQQVVHVQATAFVLANIGPSTGLPERPWYNVASCASWE